MFNSKTHEFKYRRLMFIYCSRSQQIKRHQTSEKLSINASIEACQTLAANFTGGQHKLQRNAICATKNRAYVPLSKLCPLLGMCLPNIRKSCDVPRYSSGTYSKLCFWVQVEEKLLEKTFESYNFNDTPMLIMYFFINTLLLKIASQLIWRSLLIAYENKTSVMMASTFARPFRECISGKEQII